MLRSPCALVLHPRSRHGPVSRLRHHLRAALPGPVSDPQPVNRLRASLLPHTLQSPSLRRCYQPTRRPHLLGLGRAVHGRERNIPRRSPPTRAPRSPHSRNLRIPAFVANRQHPRVPSSPPHLIHRLSSSLRPMATRRPASPQQRRSPCPASPASCFSR